MATTSMDIQEIMEQIPHRFPFLMIDRVLELDLEAGTVVARKNVTANEPQFTGHFPGVPVMPGVLIVEAMAQACAIIALGRLPEGLDRKNSLFYFAGINHARFKRVVQPGDTMVLKGQFVRQKMGLGIFQVQALVDDKVVCDAELMCAYRPIPGKQKAD